MFCRITGLTHLPSKIKNGRMVLDKRNHGEAEQPM
jgi:hypothetical protein